MLTQIYEIEAFAGAVTRYARTQDGKRFSVEFGDVGPATTIKGNTIKIMLPRLNDKLTEEDGINLRWYILHEIAHHTEGPELFDIAKENALDPSKSPLAGLLNAFEDNRIEREQAKKFKGDRAILSEAFGNMLKEEEHAKRYQHIDPENKYMVGMGAAMLADIESRTHWNAGAAAHGNKVIDSAPDYVREALSKLEDAGIVDALRNLQSSQDSFELAKQAFELLFEEDADEHIEQQKQEQKGGEGESGGEEGDGEEQEGDSSGNEEGKGQEKGGVDEKGGVADYTEFLRSEHSGEAGGTGVKLDYSNYDPSDYWNHPYEPCPLDEIMVAWWNKNKTQPSNLQGMGESWIARDIKKRAERMSHKVGRGFANKVRRLLQIRSQSRYIGGAKKGRVHRKNLYRAAVPQVGNGEWNAKVFKEKYKSDVLDVAVTVLTDFSGSMMGPKVCHAIDASCMLHDSISKSLHVPLEVLAFSELYARTVIGVAKEFDERVSSEKVRENLVQTGQFMSQNADGDAILWAYRRLRGRKEKRKILIVLSDGSPASSRNGDAMGFTQNVVKEIENEGIVEIVGVGIMDRNVDLIYTNRETINRADQLEAAVLSIIKRKIIP